MFLNAVAAEEASNPALDSVPSNVTVSSTETPNEWAMGPTMDIDVCNLLKSSADLLVDADITSRRCVVLLLSRPKALSADPAKSAALPKSVFTAAANFRTDSCMLPISISEKPRRANAICNSSTCVAVNWVVRPRSFAACVISANSPVDFPNTAANSELFFSKSMFTLRACLVTPTRALTAAVTDAY